MDIQETGGFIEVAAGLLKCMPDDRPFGSVDLIILRNARFAHIMRGQTLQHGQSNEDPGANIDIPVAVR
jgi:hypothetical protein